MLQEYNIFTEEFCKLTEYDIFYNNVIIQYNKKKTNDELIKSFEIDSLNDNESAITKYNDYINQYNLINKEYSILHKLINIESKKNKINYIKDEINCFKLFKYNDLTTLNKINNNKKILLWVDGYNSSFIHYHVTKKLENIDVIVIDLKNCGRSKNEEEIPHDCSDFSLYFNQIDFIINLHCKKYEEIILYGHSMGGFIVTLYANNIKSSLNQYPMKIILNSPFFDLYSPRKKLLLFILKYVIYYFYKYILSYFFNINFKSFNIQKGGSINYYVLIKNINYYSNEKLSSVINLPKTLGFFINLIKNINLLKSNKIKINYPTLILHSEKSEYNKKNIKTFFKSDTVLSIDHIKKYSSYLGDKEKIKVIEIKNGCHDLLLSSVHVNENVISVIQKFIN